MRTSGCRVRMTTLVSRSDRHRYRPTLTSATKSFDVDAVFTYRASRFKVVVKKAKSGRAILYWKRAFLSRRLFFLNFAFLMAGAKNSSLMALVRRDGAPTRGYQLESRKSKASD